MDNVGNKNNKVKYENLADRSDKDQIWDHHRKETDLVSVLYEQDKTKEEILEFIAKHGINYPITMGKENFR